MSDHVNRINIETVIDKPTTPFRYTPEILGVPAMEATGKGVKICVIDSGIPDHKSIGNISASANFAGSDDNEDFIGHSTVVSGLIFGNKPDEFVGIAPDAEGYYAKVIDDSAKTRLDSIVAAVLWGTIKECDIICLALCSPVDSPSVHDAIRKANDSGVLVISCMGEPGQPAYPAMYEEVLSVGALTGQMQLAPFSEKGDVNIIGSKMMSTYFEQKYTIVSGSSISTALATGIAARFIEARRNTGSPIAPNIIKSVMTSALPRI